MTNTIDFILKESFGLSEFRKGQKEIIHHILNKKDVIAVIPTGGGKSLCYQIPAIYFNQLIIVISPLIALMKDQVSNLKKKGIPAGYLFSGQNELEKISIFNQIKKNNSFILYLSPERIQKEGFKKWIATQNVSLFAIDEAHCISQWGHDFRKEYTCLKILKEVRPEVPIIALTASATSSIIEEISINLNLNKPLKMCYGFYRKNLYYQVERCESEIKKKHLLTAAILKTQNGRILIYCSTRSKTEAVYAYLTNTFNSVGFYHAGLSIENRHQIQEKYITGQIRILVATNAFGMGVDQDDVRLVIHYQPPSSLDALYQETGRAGRDNKKAHCLLLYSVRDFNLQKYILNSSNSNNEIEENKCKKLKKIVEYAVNNECRHKVILKYYNDYLKIKKCGHCDQCEPNYRI